MSNGGGAVARRGGVALGVAACLLLAACGSGTDSDLDERVAELEEENESLRAQLEALEHDAEHGGAVGTPAGSVDATDTSTPSSPSTTTVGADDDAAPGSGITGEPTSTRRAGSGG